MNIAALALVSLALAGPPNLLTNGGFESPVAPNGFSFHAAIPGWTVVDNRQFEIWRGYSGYVSAEGEQHIELDVFEPTTIYQDIPTIPGEQYRIRFAFAPRPDIPDNSLEVSWDGQVLDVLSASGVGHPALQWTYHEYTPLATGPLTRLQFRAVDPPNAYGTLLDDVSVTGASCPGDVNGDNVINFLDLNALLGAFGATTGQPNFLPAADFNADGVIDFLDLNVVLSFFGTSC